MNYQMDHQYMQQPQYHHPPPQQQHVDIKPPQQYQAPPAPMPPMPAPIPVTAPPAPRRAKKPARDPGAPKRNMSAYLLYQNAMREQFKAQNPGMSFGQLSKYTSAMYAQLTPEEKEAWQARAEADKARYGHELNTYMPPPGYDQKGEQIVVIPKVKGSKRVHKDVNAPKKNVSAYLLYQNAMRDKFKRDNPGMSFGQLSKYTSHMYKNLSTEEKAAWEQVAQQDKERFEAEMAAYEPPPGHDARGVLVVEEEAYGGGGRKRKRPRDPSAPKRNKGSFVLFAEEERPRIKSEFPDIKFTDMGVILGERWRALTALQKTRFEGLANEDKIRFANAMEEYNRQHGLPTDNKGARNAPTLSTLPSLAAGPAPIPTAGHHQMPPQAAPPAMHAIGGDPQQVAQHLPPASYGDPSMTMYQNHQQL
jgi:hypothetical protein